MRPALLQFARFIVAGAVNTVASYAIFLVLLQFMPRIIRQLVINVENNVLLYPFALHNSAFRRKKN